MKKHFLLQSMLVVLFGFQLAWAGSSGKISGKITDVTTGEPLVGANVVIPDINMGGATDLEGEFYIIHVPVGVYTVKVNMIGYQGVSITDVRVKTDLTTPLEVEMNPTILESGESVIVEAKRPMIQKDLTASRNIMTSEDIENIPVQQVSDIVELSAGFVDGHARGGRMGEVVYMVNGVSAVDPMSNNFEAEIPQGAVEEISVYTGGFSAEYSNAQSGVVNVITKEGGSSYSGKFRYRTSALGAEDDKLAADERTFFSLNDHHRIKDLEYAIGGPIPYLPATFFISGEVRDDAGRWTGNYDNLKSYTWKIATRPTQKDNVTISGLLGLKDQGNYDHTYRLPTHENEDVDGDGHVDYVRTYLSEDPNVKRWILEDSDGDGDYLNEDRDGNKILTIADLNFNGDSSDVLQMNNHIEMYDSDNNQVSLNWSHSLSATSFFEVNVSRYQTSMMYNIDEKLNEDRNMNGILDNGEDYNQNGKIDPIDWDLLTDFDDDGYIDASQYAGWNPTKDVSDWGDRAGTEDDWMAWEDVELGDGIEDGDKIKMFGNGLNYDRFRWNYDQKTVYTLKGNYTTQWNKQNTLKSGFEYTSYNIFDHDVDIASGGNVYGQNVGYLDGHGEEGQTDLKPTIAGAFAENKMEYDGMIVNAGIRLDYFDPATDTYTVNENEEIDDTTSISPKYYVSPRLGIAHPITERDVFYFNYGQYFQIPVFRLLYDNLNWDLSGAFPRVGNPDLAPERTTSYEIGIRHQFSENIAGEIKGFYKDISGLTSTQQVYYSASNYYSIYINTDYGNVRGFELSLDKRFSNYFGGSIDYSYSVAKGKASSPTAAYSQTWAGQVVPKKEQFLDWDQRHTIYAILNYVIPVVDVHGNFTAEYGSGLPYTPPSSSLDVPLNTERRPATFNADMFLEKGFSLGNSGDLQIFMWVNNVFSNKNLLGISDVNWYTQYTQIQERYDAEDDVYFGSEDNSNGLDDDGDGFIDESLEDEYMMLMDTNGDGEVDDNKLYPAGGSRGFPGFYSEPRTWRIGISYKF
ncbi:MAG: TonB-dependent receptor [Candidatus Marinimicrobia bacterium]|nr:TonB-dependent receptor [Candidatus Neomarinimicrobiota bacterium]